MVFEILFPEFFTIINMSFHGKIIIALLIMALLMATLLFAIEKNIVLTLFFILLAIIELWIFRLRDSDLEMLVKWESQIIFKALIATAIIFLIYYLFSFF